MAEPTQLDRIENALRFLVDRVGWQYRNAWDGYSGEELKRAVAREDAQRVQGIENVMLTGCPYLTQEQMAEIDRKTSND